MFKIHPLVTYCSLSICLIIFLSVGTYHYLYPLYPGKLAAKSAAEYYKELRADFDELEKGDLFQFDDHWYFVKRSFPVGQEMRLFAQQKDSVGHWFDLPSTNIAGRLQNVVRYKDPEDPDHSRWIVAAKEFMLGEDIY